MRIKWAITDESAKFVRLSAWNIRPRLSDLDDLESAGLSVIKFQYCGSGHGEEKKSGEEGIGPETFENGWLFWDAIHITCRKEAAWNPSAMELRVAV